MSSAVGVVCFVPLVCIVAWPDVREYKPYMYCHCMMWAGHGMCTMQEGLC